MTVVSGQSGTGKTDHQYSYLQTVMQVNDSEHVAEQISTSVLTLYIHAGSHTILLYPRRFSPYISLPVLTLYYIHVGSHSIYPCQFSHMPVLSSHVGSHTIHVGSHTIYPRWLSHYIFTLVLTLYIHVGSHCISTLVLTLYIHVGSHTIHVGFHTIVPIKGCLYVVRGPSEH